MAAGHNPGPTPGYQDRKSRNHRRGKASEIHRAQEWAFRRVAAKLGELCSCETRFVSVVCGSELKPSGSDSFKAGCRPGLHEPVGLGLVIIVD